jgi:3-deoxy-7-phosphoheptulonate synthase
VIAGANMVLADFHPAPNRALVDGPQALLLEELPHFLEDVQIIREAFEKRVALASVYRGDAAPSPSALLVAN